MPARFGYFPADYWVPLAPDPSSNRGNHLLGALARLKPGVTIAQANDDISGVAAGRSWRRDAPSSSGSRTPTTPFRPAIRGSCTAAW